jgi:hypothetical protein
MIPIQFNYIPYPLWRRAGFRLLNRMARPLFQRLLAMGADGPALGIYRKTMPIMR